MTKENPGRQSAAGNREMAEVELFGQRLTNAPMDDAVAWIGERALRGEKTVLNFINAHCVNVAANDNDYRHALARSSRLYPDGSGIALAMRLHGKRLVANLNGTDLFPPLCAHAAQHGLSLFLLGGQPGVAERVAERMQKQFPELAIAGTQHGFFDPQDTLGIVERINASGADILLVAMGVPRQEKWIDEFGPALETPVNIGVGGLFDFYSDRISRAPLFLRRLGLEWCWRLRQEPGRMWRRYVLGNPAFVCRAIRDAVAARRLHRVIERPARAAAGATSRRLAWLTRRGLGRAGKRVLDVSVAAAALVAAAPLMATTMLAIRMESPGPVFFSQQRVGLNGRTFRLWKFRSMYIDAEARKARLADHNEMQGGVLFKMQHDPRITRVGRVIRRFSIDELPQLWNVLRGDMSLVGPRPALPNEVRQYTLGQRGRLTARPGITCIWQVSGRSSIPFEKQVEMDLEYINRASLGTDLQLLVKTVPAVLSGNGAY